MAKDIWSILRKKYPEKEYALMSEVSDAAGFSRSRSADYMVVSLWPSRGLAINGIELKSFRSDWLNELKKPEKAENVFKYCDYFWLLTTDDTIAKIEEIPETWGWMYIKGEKIIIKKAAPKLTPLPINKHMLCTMLKRAQDKTQFIHRDSIATEIEAAKQSVKDSNKNNQEYLQSQLKEKNRQITEFYEASGIDIRGNGWMSSTKKVGAAVKFIENGGAAAMKQELIKLEESAKLILENISKGIKSLENIN